ncbi:MAG: glucose-6-phosphate isomerase, partial [Xanthomonadales bacterium]|nr:glucose-6-phosphate isomerase [Xanthomonadales bacterium]
MNTPSPRFSWQAMRDYARSELPSLRDLSADPARCERYEFRFQGLHLDLSKCRIDSELLGLGLGQLDRLDLSGQLRELQAGARLNRSEDRPALHSLVRAESSPHPSLNQAHSEVLEQRESMLTLAQALFEHAGSQVGLIDADRVINIGIGGSDLGPRLVADALTAEPGPELRFVANVDGHALNLALRGANPERTLFVVSSKTFGTRETLLNALSARQWLREHGVSEDRLSRHFVGCTAKPAAAGAFGVGRMVAFDQSVGGRYSLWSSVGLAAAAGIGRSAFEQLLAGAAAMDRHCLEAPMIRCLPVLAALAQCMDRVLWSYPTRAVVAYDERLSLLPAFLQQLEMESNGKAVDDHGQRLDHPAAAVIWGGTGTAGQHAYFQSLHQGLDVVPVDFLGCIAPGHQRLEHHQVLLANMLAQSAALLKGSAVDSESDPALAAARLCPGERPSTTLLLERLDPATLGALLAFYEHKVFVQSRIYGNNPFDQWGVEL